MSLTTPLNNRGLKLPVKSLVSETCLTTPLNNRGLKPQDIVYFAGFEGFTPQVIFHLQEKSKKIPDAAKKSHIGDCLCR